ncbi:MAG: 3-phosphoserine/phosphohydroxythreonine transaminase [Erysipelotrichales bacterium]|nr:MAG: 3-phosphoserine/phosphohydroxythreonine transaminase [Erysipelotrichales bacterium]
MERVYNFSAGPSTLPESVLRKAADEMLNYHGTGMSVMEMSHRSSAYEAIHAKAKQDLIDLLHIPSNYKVLFLQGGGSLQFAMVPLNLLRNSKKADYIDSGEWSKKAYKEASKFGDIQVVASSEADNYSHLPAFTLADVRPDADYVYFVSNNTIFGTRFTEFPDFKDHVVVSDMSSDILSRPFDVSKFGLIFAGAQKNIGMAGLTVAIIREDLLGFADPQTPAMLDYQTIAKGDSLYNTPPTYAIYLAGLMFEWLKELGGVEAMHAINQAKAKLIYDVLDNGDFFKGTVDPKDRSMMNITFRCPSPEADKAFIAFAESRGLVNLKGYRTVGGMRASIYNAMPIEGVQALVEAMNLFEKQWKAQ